MRRRALYVVCVILSSLLPAVGVLSVMGFPHRTTHSALTLAAWYSAAVLITAVNLWTSYVRGWLWIRRHGSLEGHRFTSGLPLIGTLAAGVAAVCTAGDWVSGLLAVMLAVLDTGGLTWFALQVCRHDLFD